MPMMRRTDNAPLSSVLLVPSLPPFRALFFVVVVAQVQPVLDKLISDFGEGGEL